MKQIRTAGILALTIVLLSACHTTPVDNRPVNALSGAELYQRLCSSCHGVAARGDGPVAPLIKIHVPDLTMLAHLDGGEFPTEDVRRVIDGRWDQTAHGARDMPVWGWRLYDTSSPNAASERAEVDSLIDRLVEYLRSVQRQ